MSESPVFVGIDVAKAQLDIAVRPTGVRLSAPPNDEAGIATLVTQLQAVAPTLIVLEATGGFQRGVVAALTVVGLPVVWPTRGRPAILPKRRASWRKPMPWTLGPWPTLRTRSGRHPARYRMRRRQPCAPC